VGDPTLSVWLHPARSDIIGPSITGCVCTAEIAAILSRCCWLRWVRGLVVVDVVLHRANGWRRRRERTVEVRSNASKRGDDIGALDVSASTACYGRLVSEDDNLLSGGWRCRQETIVL